MLIVTHLKLKIEDGWDFQVLYFQGFKLNATWLFRSFLLVNSNFSIFIDNLERQFYVFNTIIYTNGLILASSSTNVRTGTAPLV